jgi:hypothetical protein
MGYSCEWTWMRTRDVQVAHDRVLDAIKGLTNGAGWESVELTHHILTTRPVILWARRLERSRLSPGLDSSCGLTDLEHLTDDPVTHQALKRFGRCALRCIASGPTIMDNLYAFRWVFDGAERAPELLRWVMAHQVERGPTDDRPCFELTLSSAMDLRLTRPGQSERLPFQEAEHYPVDTDHNQDHACRNWFRLSVPENRLSLDCTWPFEGPGREFTKAYDAFCKALGFRLSQTNFRRLIPNKAGTKMVARKVEL